MDKNEKKDEEKTKEKAENREGLSNEEVVSENNNDEIDNDSAMDNITPTYGADDNQSKWDKAGFDSNDIKIYDDSDDDEVDDNDDIDTNTLLKILIQVHNIKSKKEKKEKNASLPCVKKFLNASISKKSKLYSNALLKKLIFLADNVVQNRIKINTTDTERSMLKRIAHRKFDQSDMKILLIEDFTINSCLRRAVKLIEKSK